VNQFNRFVFALAVTVCGFSFSASAQSKDATAETKTVPAAEAPNLPKFSGFIQGRFEWHEDSQNGLLDNGKPGTTTQFGIKRGRIKAVHDTDLSQFVLSIDATPAGVSLKDAEATLIEPWTGVALRLTVGQFKIPFGYEITESDDAMLMPERSRMIRVLFPGDRDRGARLSGKYEMLRFSAAIINGNGINDPIYGASDQSSDKDVVGRIGVDSGGIAMGLSAYYGHAIKTTVGATPAVPAVYEETLKARVGGDVQLSSDFVSSGKTTAKIEMVSGADSGNVFFGYYLQMSQAIYEFSPFVRFDTFASKMYTVDATYTLGGGLEWLASKNLRLTAVYEHPWVNTPGLVVSAPQQFTTQLQAKF